MRILGIESSCDETAVAVVQSGRVVLSSVIASQIAQHAPFGGVIPEIAAREHLTNIGPLLDTALTKANLTIGQIDAVAVTQGPGLIGPLLVGASFAQAIGAHRRIPVIPVDHVHAHVFGTILSYAGDLDQLFPSLAAVVSGGHTNLYRMKNITSFELIGYSLDDACGECFDKVGKMLGLPYPGGPHIERLAATGDVNAFPMPNLHIAKDELRFSFSGLKTHMLNSIRKLGKDISQEQVANICASFQRAAFKQIVNRLDHEWRGFGSYRSLIISGGVAANKTFRTTLDEMMKATVLFPQVAYCGDNAAMVASYAYFLQKSSGQTPSQSWEPYSTYRYEQVQ